MFPELEKAAKAIASLPGIGKKSAYRIAFHLLRQSPENFAHFTAILSDFHAKTGNCPNCGALKSRESECGFCSDRRRQSALLCVVEMPSDVFSIENTGEFHGSYHVLMGALSPLDGIRPEDLRFESLKQRLLKEPYREIILAMNPSIEGNATAHYVSALVEDLRSAHPQSEHLKTLQLSRIASGLAAGAVLDYADTQVISQSLRSRIPWESIR